MPQVIEVPGHGQVEFPDGMSDQDITAAIQKNLAPPAKASYTDTSYIAKSIASPLTGSLSRLMGVADTGMSVAQMGAHAIGAGDAFESGRHKINEQFEKVRQKMSPSGEAPGYDFDRLAGSTAGPSMVASKLAAAAPLIKGKTIADATGALGVTGRAILGSAQGGTGAALQPVEPTEEGFWTPKFQQVGAGGMTGGVLSLGMDAIGAISRLARQAAQPLTEKGRAEILRTFQDSVMGQDPNVKAQMLQAAAQAKPGVGGVMPTVGEALSDIPQSTGIAAHQADIARLPGVSPAFTQRAAAQEAARADVLAPIARNPGALAGDIAVRNTVTAPMRESALGAVNARGEVARTIADKMANLKNLSEQQQQRIAALSQPSVNRTLVSSGPSDALRSAVEIHAPYAPPDIPTAVEKVAGAHLQSRFADTMAKQAKDLGVAKSNLAALNKMQDIMGSIPVPPPLKAQTLVRELDRTLKIPEVTGSPLTKQTFGAIRQHIADMADEHGIIDADALYQFKKEGVNQLIDDAMGQANPKFAKEFRATHLIGLKKSIDDAIEKAGGKGWRDYLAKYQELSAGPNRMETGQVLQKALTAPLENSERGQVFAKTIRDTDLSALTEPDRIAVRKVAEELSRKDAYERLARGTKISGKDAIPGDVGLPLPNLLWRPSMVANFMMKHFAKGAEDKMAQIAQQQYLNPPLWAQSMQPPMPSRYQPMIDALLQRQAGMAGTTAGRMMGGEQ